jgi:hypothetical protein
LSVDQSRWIAARPNFLFPVTALSRVFRGKFLDLLKQACEKGKIPAATNEIKASRQKNWVVYAKKPFGSPQTVLDYLGRYTHRVALSNNRILGLENSQVTFSFSQRLIRLRRNRDRKDGDRKKALPLDAHEFIRRFLANRTKKHALPQCRTLLGLNPALPEIPQKSAHDLLLELTGIDLSRCPRCQKGMMIVVGELPRISYSAPWDSS